MNEFVTNYDHLPKDDEKPAKPLYLHEVDATQASISHHGFAHFSKCLSLLLMLVVCYI